METLNIQSDSLKFLVKLTNTTQGILKDKLDTISKLGMVNAKNNAEKIVNSFSLVNVVEEINSLKENFENKVNVQEDFSEMLKKMKEEQKPNSSLNTKL